LDTVHQNGCQLYTLLPVQKGSKLASGVFIYCHQLQRLWFRY